MSTEFEVSKYVPCGGSCCSSKQASGRACDGRLFEPNGAPLWANVRKSVEDFLHGLFQQGALMGAKPEEAFS